jgi:predicted  nucleic acid-binding Zn-ribbon protein
MTVTNDLMYELLKRMQGDLSDLKRDVLSMGIQLASVEQHAAASQVEIARISSDMARMKTDVGTIKRRLDLVEA